MLNMHHHHSPPMQHQSTVTVAVILDVRTGHAAMTLQQ